MTSTQLVWLVTGTSSGLGRSLCLAALQRGDKVIATARNSSKIDSELKEKGANVIELDVSDSIDNLKKIAAEALAIHGCVDVLVNNAGVLSLRPTEEETPEETLHQFSVNVLGPLNVARAFLPAMRERGSGAIFFMGAMGSYLGGVPCAGTYISTKLAIRGLAESLNLEVSPMGIKVHCIEPGYFKTSLLTQVTNYEPRIPAYHDMATKRHELISEYDGHQPGDPQRLAEIVVDIARQEGIAKGGREVPVTLPLGADAYQMVKGALAKNEKTLEEWRDVIKSTDFS
ncbi:hypothetical protein FRB96_005999 [Tulasnella sp. 330]|nr:hypothetical protein FRB96_005999 [Tulasnella sp. 330]KAG8882135.1 hypothetical protein FRB97_008623 [Tulasnella sp. 331]KAG8887742.1 hypothetical protein FRB98_009126 [Tulasnella sp. 332]